jgi:hypothetical protein
MVSFTKHRVLQMNSLNTLFTPTPTSNNTYSIGRIMDWQTLFANGSTYVHVLTRLQNEEKQERIFVHQILIEC